MKLLPLLALLSSAPLAAQATLTIATDGPVSSLASAGGTVDFDAVAAGTAVGRSPRNLDVGASVNSGSTPYARSVTLAYPTGAGTLTGVNFFERAYVRGAATDRAGSSSSAAAAGATWGDHSLLCTFDSPTTVVGVLRLSFRANPGTTGTVRGSLDIDNDGTLEFSATQGGSYSVPVVIQAGVPLVARISNGCEVVGTGSTLDFQSCWTEMNLSFQEDQTATCTFNNYGTGCGGASASGAELIVGSTRVVTFVVNGAFPNMPVVSAIGDRQLNLPLLAGCNLLCNATEVSLLQADGTGTAVESHTMPLTMVGTSFHQFLPIDIVGNSLVVRTTDGLRLTCVR